MTKRVASPRPAGRPAHTERNAAILALRGTMKREDIAEKLDVSIGVVAGVCFRADRPRSPRSRIHRDQQADTR